MNRKFLHYPYYDKMTNIETSPLDHPHHVTTYTTDIVKIEKATKIVLVTKTREIILPSTVSYERFKTTSEIVFDYTTTEVVDVTETLTDSSVIVYTGTETVVEPQTTFYIPFTTSTTSVSH